MKRNIDSGELRQVKCNPFRREENLFLCSTLRGSCAKDLDGFFGLMIDNLIQLILIVSLCRELIHLPRKQPPYRQNRPHEAFLVNLNLPAPTIKSALKQSWSAAENLEDVPFDAIETLARKKYSSDEWNFRT